MPSPFLEEIAAGGHEQVVFVAHESGLRAIIAVHSTLLGPALGGIRRRAYADEAEALDDVLRLSRGMTYKNALAGLDWGGGKTVVLERDGELEAQFVALGEAIERLGGRYIGAEDVGTSPAEVAWVSRSTSHVAGFHSDAAPFTARGVLAAMRAACAHAFGTRELEGRTVAVQGAGKVGGALVGLLADAGAHVTLFDVDSARAEDAAGGRDNVEIVAAGELLSAPVDVFAPCALGGVIDAGTAERIECRIVCGAANNQLLTPAEGEALHRRGILYVPDYLANSGGVIALAERYDAEPERAAAAVDALEPRVGELLGYAAEQGIDPAVAADRLAEQRLERAAAQEPGSLSEPGSRVRPSAD